ncbi:T9SS type A sorting domain-containing protein [Tenacibaculum sp. ZS6-P6]|uniref:T9SS type A sorting domain-containing protein n=1 Tax=Tenacibaculum sp. ZS6-P6 TaxID=3447503 RepID=UPI003F989CEF
MKKNYFLTFLLTFLFSSAFSQDLIITGAIDGPLPSGAPKAIELYAVNNIADLSIYGIESTTNGAAAAGVEYTFPADAVTAGTYIYLSFEDTLINQYLGITPQYVDNVINVNGDDTVILYKNGTIEDLLGRIGEDGTGKDWDYVDGWAYRKDGQGPSATFDPNQWTFSGPNAVDGCDKSDDSGINTDCSSVFPVGTYTATASSTPSLTISSPSNGSTISFTDMATVKFSVSNFNIAAGSTGDGYIKWTLNSVAQADKFDTDDITFATTGGTTYEVFMELVDNAGNALSTPVNQTISFTVGLPCDIQISTITTSCVAETSGIDTYNVSIDFTGGGTSTYMLTTDNGTIGGDNPSMMATGTITISGITEGTNIIFTVKGDTSNSSCDFTRNISSPTCKGLPFIETFDYADASVLSDQADWESANSGDDIVTTTGSLTYSGLKPSEGNKITFNGSGAESFTKFTDVSSGTVYSSFLLKVSAFQTGSNPDTTDGGYFAGLAAGTSSYDARLWVRPNPDTSGTTFDIGFGPESSNPPFTTSTYNLGDVLFIIMAYDLDNDVVSLWINPDAATFEGAAPTPDLGGNDTNAPSSINTFILRQDSTNETPTIEIDELRIAKTWAEVTPKDNSTASVIENEIDGFGVYPNPTNNKTFTLTSASVDVKDIQIFNMIGKKVYETSVSGTKKDVNVSSISSGMYILKVVESNKVATQRLIIK